MTVQLRWVKLIFQHELRKSFIDNINVITQTASKCGIRPCSVYHRRNNYSTNSIPWYTQYETIKTKKPTAVTEYIDSLIASELDKEWAELLKELSKTNIKHLYRESVTNRNLIKCRKIHKLVLQQNDWVLAYEMVLMLKSKILSENENVLLCKIIIDSLNIAIENSAFRFYFDMRFEFRCKLGDRDVGRMLYDLLKSEVINLDMFVELMLYEHYILSEREANFIIDECHRNAKLYCMPAEVKLNQSSCPHCGSKLYKDTILQSDFEVVLNDFVVKMSSLYADRDVSTLYFKSLQTFLKMHDPFDICIDVENLYIDKKQFMKTIHTLPKDKRIFLILSNKSSIAKVNLPSNVISFKINSFAFRGQDDILTLLGVLLNGPETILISNDGYRDIITLLDDQNRDTLQRWQRINQWPVTFDENLDAVLFPKLFSRSVQMSENGWHLPYLSVDIATHDAGFLCVQKHNWEPSQTVKQIRNAREKCLHVT